MGTLKLSLPDGMKAFVDEQVAEGGYAGSSEYLSDLIGREQARIGLRKLVLDGAGSPPTGKADASYFDTLRAQALNGGPS